MSEHYRDCNGNSSAHVQGKRQLDLVLLLSSVCNTTLSENRLLFWVKHAKQSCVLACHLYDDKRSQWQQQLLLSQERFNMTIQSAL